MSLPFSCAFGSLASCHMLRKYIRHCQGRYGTLVHINCELSDIMHTLMHFFYFSQGTALPIQRYYKLPNNSLCLIEGDFVTPNQLPSYSTQGVFRKVRILVFFENFTTLRYYLIVRYPLIITTHNLSVRTIQMHRNIKPYSNTYNTY